MQIFYYFFCSELYHRYGNFYLLTLLSLIAFYISLHFIKITLEVFFLPVALYETKTRNQRWKK